MAPEVQNWILTGIVAFMLMVGWWSARTWIMTIIRELKELTRAVHELSKANIKQTAEIDNLTKRVDTSNDRLNDHSIRIKNLEIKNGNE
jgi:hypothetical protein